MGRQPCCEKVGLKRGPWAVEEDRKLVSFITRYGHGCWREVPKLAGLLRCGKSCRLRWTNYLRPDLKRGQLSDAEEKLIIDLHAAIGNRWSRIAAQLPGRTDNEIKNYWNTRIGKKLKQMGIDPVTHKPLSESFDQQQQKKKINKPINKKLGSSESQLESTNTASTIIKDHGNSQDSNEAQCCASGECKGSVSKATTSGAIGLSKKEKMEVESREAHIKVQKMRAAVHAFNNSRSSPPSVISSPTTSSAITLPHNTVNEDLDDSLFIDPSRVRDSIINNIISAKRPFLKHHPYFPFSQALESSPSYAMQTIPQDCDMFENLQDRDNVELDYGNQALSSFVYEDRPHLNDWFSAQTFPEAVGHTRALQLASLAAPIASSHCQNPTQEPASYQWKAALGWEDTKPSMKNCSPCSTLHVPLLESSISSSLAIASSSGGSSWNSILQQLLEDGSMPCGSLDSKTTTLTPGSATFAASELQQLASLLDEI